MNKEIEEAIGNCNLFVQADATINLVDEKEGKLVFKTCNTHDIETVLNYIKDLQRENNHLRDADLTSVYLKGVYDGKEQATIDNSICKEKMTEDALQENMRLKKELADSTPNSTIREKIEELKNNLHTVEHYETVGAIKVLQEVLEEGEVI